MKKKGSSGSSIIKKNQEVNTTNKVYKEEGRQTTSGAERDGETVGNCHRELRFN